MNRKIFYGFLFGIPLFFFSAYISYAYTIAISALTQTNKSSLISNLPTGNFNQSWNLGTGLSSPLSDYTLNFNVNKVVGGDEAVFLTILCYNDSAYTSSCGTFVSSASYTPPKNTQGDYTFHIATTTQPVFNSTKYYRVTSFAVAGSVYAIKLYGKVTPNICSSNCTGSPYQIGYTTFQGATLTQATATSSSFFSGQSATSTYEALAGQCAEEGNIFSRGLCVAGVFLFIPSAQTLGQYSQLKDTLGVKFPFSYVVSATDTWKELTASSTANAPTWTYDFGDLGFGSTTPMGNILPNITVFSSSTVTQYFPTGTFDLLRGLASIALILGLIADIFFTSRNLMH